MTSAQTQIFGGGVKFEQEFPARPHSGHVTSNSRWVMRLSPTSRGIFKRHNTSTAKVALSVMLQAITQTHHIVFDFNHTQSGFRFQTHPKWFWFQPGNNSFLLYYGWEAYYRSWCMDWCPKKGVDLKQLSSNFSSLCEHTVPCFSFHHYRSMFTCSSFRASSQCPSKSAIFVTDCYCLAMLELHVLQCHI